MTSEIVLEDGGVHLAIDPSRGGRVTSLRLGRAEILTGPELHPTNYGSTLWTSPQAAWGWPPPAAFDDLPYEVRRDGDAVTLVGPVDPTLNVRLHKRFAVDGRGTVLTDSRVENVGREPVSLAPWQVTRVPARGLTFYPTGASWGGPLAVDRRDGTTWYLHDPGVLDATGAKSFGDGVHGYVAHVHDGLLLVKRFVDHPPELHAPGHGEVEVYGNDLYVEVEVQGPYAAIAPGGLSPSWIVEWRLARVPAGIDVRVGSTALVEFASRLAT